MSTKNVILKDKNGNQLAPATIAEQVSYDATHNIKQALGLASGHATTANNAADMTDTTRIYVYTGSESGYTAGNWYYYNGSAWVSGGEYTDSVQFETDKTLEVSGKAADAKATGDALAAQETEITNLTTNIEFMENDGYFDATGTIVASTASKEKYTNLIRVINGMRVEWKYQMSVKKTLWAAYILYDETGTRLTSRQTLINELNSKASGIISIPKNAAYIRFCYRTYGEENVFTLSVVNYDLILSLNESFTDETDIVIKEYEVNSVSYTIYNLTKGLYEIDATQLETGDGIRGHLTSTDNEQNVMVKKGDKAYFYISDNGSSLYLRVFPDLTSYSGSITVTKINKYNAYNDVVETKLDKKYSDIVISEDKLRLHKTWLNGGAISYGGRIAVGLIDYTGKFTVSISDYTNYKFAIIQYSNSDLTYINWDTGWITSGERTISNDFGRSFGITLSRVSGQITSLSELDDIGLVIKPVGGYYDKIATLDDVFDLERKISQYGDASQEINNNSIKSNLAVFPGRFKPCYDHLFVNKTGANVVIPHESLYHVRLSRKMGFNVIEANVMATKDGVYIVNHLNGGKFGGYFHHIDGETDISDIAVNSVTWDWIVLNVRYNSQIEKYKTRPCRLEEFLSECKQQNIIPFITTTDVNVIKMANDYLGQGNYIAYGANRANCPEAIIYHWVTLTSESAILAYCESIGKPFIYGMSNPTAFTDSELRSIISTLHENGYLIGISYADNLWYKYLGLGFDFNGTQNSINRIDNGNLYNLDSIFGFDSFTVVNATETDGILTFTSAGTITPDISNEIYDVCGIDIEIIFNGTITLNAIGERSATSYTSNGDYPIFISVPIINGSPKFTLQCTSGTVVYDLSFKASKF